MNSSANKQSVRDFRPETDKLRGLILGMRSAYTRGENAMEYARRESVSSVNTVVATLIAYDLQAGSYIAAARANPERQAIWCNQLAEILDALVTDQSSILEVGCGEATTHAGVLQRLSHTPQHALGFDISWSRCAQGLSWLAEKAVHARMFVADLFEIPLEDASIDVVYTSHSIEPNGGREEMALRELLRVSRQAVVLVEPIYELASAEAQARMRHHGYVRGLKDTANRMDAKVTDYRLLEHTSNPLNPSGLILIEKDAHKREGGRLESPAWRCPLTYTPLRDVEDVFVSDDLGLVYPVLRGIPLLRAEHVVIASGIVESGIKLL
jgi:SAM-dependent methyltransferase